MKFSRDISSTSPAVGSEAGRRAASNAHDGAGHEPNDGGQPGIDERSGYDGLPSPGGRPSMTAGQRAARYGVLTAAALVCGYLELLIPVPVGIPGIKLGLGNAVVLIAIERLGARSGLYLMFAKVFASTLLFANVQMLVFSLCGGLLSWAVMATASRSGWFSPVSISVLGGIAHNAGQLVAVAVLLSTQVALVNAPALALAGVVCGAAVGVVCQLVLRALPTEVFHGQR